jgi:hypothetical protein
MRQVLNVVWDHHGISSRRRDYALQRTMSFVQLRGAARPDELR